LGDKVNNLNHFKQNRELRGKNFKSSEFFCESSDFCREACDRTALNTRHLKWYKILVYRLAFSGNSSIPSLVTGNRELPWSLSEYGCDEFKSVAMRI